MTVKGRKSVAVAGISALICCAALLSLGPRHSAAEGSQLPHRAMIPQLASDSANGVLVLPTVTPTPKATPTPIPTPTPAYVPPTSGPGGYRY